jgi:hypothetical protein
MKKIILIIALAFIGLNVNAQNQKGAILLGGSSNGNITLSPSTNIHLGANLHYFLSEKIALGGGLGFNKLDGMDAETTISLAGRYYLNSKMYGNVTYGLTEGASNQGLTVGAGYQMMLSDKVAFLSGLDYWMNPADGADASISLNMGISVFIR